MLIETIPVGVELERHPSRSRWLDHSWRVVGLRPGHTDLAAWTILSEDAGISRYFAGNGRITFRSADTKVLKDNLESRSPSVYVVLRPDRSPTNWTLYLVTVDPSEAHAHVDVGADFVEALPMPAAIQARLMAFVARHHVERRTLATRA